MIDPSINHRNRPAVLSLVHRVPYPPDKGDRIRTFQILRYLAERADVHLACLADEPVDSHVLQTLKRYCKRVSCVSVRGPLRWARGLFSLALGRTVTEGAFHSPELLEVVRDWARTTPFDAVLGSASSMVPYMRLPELRDTPAVIDLIDVDSQKWLDYAARAGASRSWLYRTEGRRLRRLERDITRWARAVILVSEAEAEIYRGFCAPGNVEAVGNGVDIDYFRPQPALDEQGCVFLGALDYWPNVEGIEWFCREVWPEVRRRHPATTISLVGRRPTPAVCGLTRIPGVRLVGQVPDVRPYLDQAAISIVPLRIARGIQNKVLESMAMVKATIVSPQACEGLAAQPGTDLLCAESPGQWADAISSLLDDASLRRRLGTAGRRYVETAHCWQRCLEPLDRLLGLASEPAPVASPSIPFPAPAVSAS